MATEFTIFPSFPPEIREMIWVESILGRVITLWHYQYEELDEEWNDDEARNNNPTLPHLISESALPAIFTVNRESHQIALRNYQVFYGKRSCPNPFYHKKYYRPSPTVDIQFCQNPFYFNLAVDTIFLPGLRDYDSFMKYTSSCDEMKLIRYFAMSINWYQHEALTSARYEELAELELLENLESLTVDIPYRSDPNERIELRKQLQKFWKKDREEEGDSEKKDKSDEGDLEDVVERMPDIVILEQKGMDSWLSSVDPIAHPLVEHGAEKEAVAEPSSPPPHFL